MPEQDIAGLLCKLQDINKKLESTIKDCHRTSTAQSIGLQNVYAEFKKYSAENIFQKIEAINKRLDHYEREKNVQSFDLNVQSFPMSIRINLQIKTNFGSIDYTYDYPPSLEYQLGKNIGGVYNKLLNKLYEEHESRGGKFIGQEGCKAWMDDNVETIVHMAPMLIDEFKLHVY